MFVPDGWLSQTVGHPCYRFAGTNVGDVDVDVTVNKMSELSRGCRQTFFFAKLATQSVSAVANLERCGFGVVDTNVVLQWVG